MLVDRLAVAALRGVLLELEGDPGGAAEVLRRVLAPAPAAPPLEAPVEATPAPPPAPTVARRDPKPSKAPARRPARTTPTPPNASPPEQAEPEGARLVLALEERHGDLATVASRFGLNRELLRRWKRGTACSPRTLERLRVALAAPPLKVAAAEPDDDDDQGDDDQGDEAPAPAPSRYGARKRAGAAWPPARAQRHDEEPGEAEEATAGGEESSAGAGSAA